MNHRRWRLFAASLVGLVCMIPSAVFAMQIHYGILLIDTVTGSSWVPDTVSGKWLLMPSFHEQISSTSSAVVFDILRHARRIIPPTTLSKIPTMKDSWLGDQSTVDSYLGQFVSASNDTGRVWFIDPQRRRRIYITPTSASGHYFLNTLAAAIEVEESLPRAATGQPLLPAGCETVSPLPVIVLNAPSTVHVGQQIPYTYQLSYDGPVRNFDVESMSTGVMGNMKLLGGTTTTVSGGNFPIASTSDIGGQYQLSVGVWTDPLCPPIVTAGATVTVVP